MAKIPVFHDFRQLNEYLNRSQRALKPILKRVRTPGIPFNFRATSQQGGNKLEWAAADGADGYVIEWASTENFEAGFSAIPLRDQDQLEYFDSVPTSGGAAPARRCYRMYSTAGTTHNPHSIKGEYTQTLCSDAIAPDDTVTAEVSNQDDSTDDEYQSRAGRFGRYTL
jgi:hypothetical protein